jgi:hypothetical protein
MATQLATIVPAPLAGASPLLTKNGQPMPPSSNYLQMQEEAQRHKRLDDAWQWYRGEVKGPFRPEPGQPDVNVSTNRSSAIVDTGVDFLMGHVVTLEVTYKGKPQKDAQACLDGCWGNENRRMVTFSKLAQNGGIFGHVFAKIIPPDPSRMRPYARTVPLDPAQVTVVTDPQDCDTVLAYMVQWNEGADAGGGSETFNQLTIGRMQMIRRIDPDNDADEYSYGLDPDSTWEISNWMHGPGGKWFQTGAPETWDHPWAPVVDWQNLPLANMHWGASDIPPNVQHLNSVLNLTLSNINAIAKHHSFPWMYASGVGLGATIEMAPGRITQLQSPEGKITALEAHGDLAGLLAFAADLRADMDEQTRVPAIATGRFKELPRVTSGVALQMLYGPLLAKNMHKQRTYGEGIAEDSLRMLSLCGFGDGTGLDGWEVHSNWPDPLPSDDLPVAQIAQVLDAVGASQHSVFERLGLDYDEETEYKAEEAQDAMKAAMKGQAMPQLAPAVPGQPGGEPAPATQPGGAPGAAVGAGVPGTAGPPVNHPAAVAARAAASAAGAAMRSPGKVGNA